jgi:ATP-dependent Clp protease ATP-binding subunit ClpC
MFDRFTHRARKIIDLASVEAAGRGDELVDTVDVVVGMLREGSGIAAYALRNNSIGLDAVLRGRDSVCDRPDVTLADVESRSLIEADWLGHRYPGTEHLLLAVCCLDQSRGARLLACLGYHPVQLCSYVIDMLGRTDEWERWLVTHPGISCGGRQSQE